MRRDRAWALAVTLAAAGCAAPAPPRWEITRKPYKADSRDVTLLLDRDTGRAWRYDYDTDHWTPVLRPEER